MTCPFCALAAPRRRHPEFLREFQQEIRLVAFDLLLHHVEDAHHGAGQ